MSDAIKAWNASAASAKQRLQLFRANLITFNTARREWQATQQGKAQGLR